MLQNKQSISYTIIMQCDVTRCVIFMSSKVEYLDEKHSYKNSTKEGMLGTWMLFTIQPRKYWIKFCAVGAIKGIVKWMKLKL